MSQSVTGGFGDKALRKLIAQDSFVKGVLKRLYITKTVNYYSGSIGSIGGRVKHTGDYPVVKRRKKRDSSGRIRIVGAEPNLFLRVYIPSIEDSYYVEIPPSKLIELGEFKYLNGNFNLTVENHEVKVDSEKITFKNLGTFPIVRDTDSKMTYQSWQKQKSDYGTNRYVKKCGRKVENTLRKKWAEKEGLRNSIWTVLSVDDPEYSQRVTLEVQHPEISETLTFMFSMNDWDENATIRALVEKDGHGLVSNLEQEEVFVTTDKLSKEPIAKAGNWYLYRKADKPNFLTRFVKKHF